MSTLGVKIRIKNNSRNYLQARSMEESVIGASLRGIAGAARSAPSPRAARRRLVPPRSPCRAPCGVSAVGFFLLQGGDPRALPVLRARAGGHALSACGIAGDARGVVYVAACFISTLDMQSCKGSVSKDSFQF